MKIASIALVILLSGNLWAGPSRAEMSSVILSEDKAATIVIGKAERQAPYTIAFPLSQMTPLLPPNHKVLRCELRIVASLTAREKLSDQDVAVFSNDQQIGQWSAYYKQSNGPANGPVPYRVGLDPGFCNPTKDLSLQIEEPVRGDELDLLWRRRREFIRTTTSDRKLSSLPPARAEPAWHPRQAGNTTNRMEPSARRLPRGCTC